MSKQVNKEKALAALLDSNSLTEAAEKAGITRKTLYSYLHNDGDFARAFKQIRSEQTLNLIDAINTDRNNAREIIRQIMTDKEQPAAIRLKAAQAILTEAGSMDAAVSSIVAENIHRNSELFGDFYR